MDSSLAPSGGRVGRVISRPAFWAVTLAILFALPLARAFVRPVPPPPPVLGSVPPFAMTDQQGEPFGSLNLEGRVWVADFIFTACQTMCPVLTQKMALLTHRARHLGPEVHFVSFSVDPERDTPPKLAAYAATYHADPHKWSFLTGTLDSIQSAVVDGFKIGVDRHKTADDFWDIVHGEHMVVVDRALQIRGYFDSTEEGMNKLLEVLGQVTNETTAAGSAPR
jgi:protein SCO1